METLLSLTNKVLVRLREDEVTSTASSAYVTLMSQFVKQAVDEVEDATNWVQLRETIALPVTATNFAYSLTGAGTGFRILQVFEDTEDYTLNKAMSYAWMNRQLLQNNPQVGSPEYYDVNGMDSDGDAIINLWPIPNDTFSVNVNLVVKSHLNADDDTTPVPWIPIVLRAFQLALDERGDDDGASLGMLESNFKETLASAVAIDAGGYEDESVWFEE
jgi:hypothetical protein